MGPRVQGLAGTRWAFLQLTASPEMGGTLTVLRKCIERATEETSANASFSQQQKACGFHSLPPFPPPQLLVITSAGKSAP